MDSERASIMFLPLVVLAVDSKGNRILDVSVFLVVRCKGLVMMSGLEILGAGVDVV